jgi:hypothetical protein
VAAFGFAILFASATVAYALAQSARSGNSTQVSDEQKTFSGVVTDSRCGARHQDSTKSPAECTQMCVRNGAQYVLVDGDKTYALNGDTAQIAKLAGQRVSVAGSLVGDTLRVGSIQPQQ